MVYKGCRNMSAIKKQLNSKLYKCLLMQAFDQQEYNLHFSTPHNYKLKNTPCQGKYVLYLVKFSYVH